MANDQLSLLSESDDLLKRVARIERHMLDLETKYEQLIEALHSGVLKVTPGSLN